MLKGSDEPTSASSKKNLSCHADALQIWQTYQTFREFCKKVELAGMNFFSMRCMVNG